MGLRYLMAIVALAAGLVGGRALAQVNDADQAAIRQVIEQQLQAFQHDDGPGAYGFASPSIQKQFVNADIFMQMVKAGYPAVYRPKSVEFHELKTDNGMLIQQVFLIGPDGKPVLALYEMQQQPDGSWKINGCWLTQPPDQNV
jgi:Domain of unknown function (DUF4864)